MIGVAGQLFFRSLSSIHSIQSAGRNTGAATAKAIRDPQVNWAMMASEEQAAVKQAGGEEGAEGQEGQEVKEVPQASPIAAGPQPPYDEDFNPFTEAGMQV